MEQKVRIGEELLRFVEDWEAKLKPDLAAKLVELQQNPEEPKKNDVTPATLKECIVDIEKLGAEKVQKIAHFLNIVGEAGGSSGNDYLLQVLVFIKGSQEPENQA